MRSLGLGIYLALHSAGDGEYDLSALPKRPEGPLLWVHCRNARDLPAIRHLLARLDEDHGPVATLVTGAPGAALLPEDDQLILMELPTAARGLEQFLAHWQPDALIWIGAGLDAVVLAATDAHPMARFLVEAEPTALRSASSRWLPGMRRALLRRFDAILATDAVAVTGLVSAGANALQCEAVGVFEDDQTVLDFDEAERNTMAAAIGARPLWLAVNVTTSCLAEVLEAHRRACRRAHRLLLILVPAAVEEGPEMAAAARAMGMETVLRSDGDPTDSTRVYVADLEGELGLWYRLSPQVFLSGTFGGSTRHPFEAAALGSVVVHGPVTGLYAAAFDKLDRAGASVALRQPAELAGAIERLLSPDAAAEHAMAAWSITTESAELTGRLASLLAPIIAGKES